MKALPSLFDEERFSRALFAPRKDVTPPTADEVDYAVNVPGARLHLRAHHLEGAEAALLYFHGNGEVVSDLRFASVRFIAEAGVALLAVEYRGYGLSSGAPSLRALLDDARPALDAATFLAAGRPLMVMGRSLGGACATELAGAGVAGVRAWVFESAWSDLAAFVRRRGLEAPGFSVDERARFDPLPKLARCREPALVLHGEQDALIAVHEAERTFATLGSTDKHLERIAGAGHNDLQSRDAYWTALSAFLRRVARGPTEGERDRTPRPTSTSR